MYMYNVKLRAKATHSRRVASPHFNARCEGIMLEKKKEKKNRPPKQTKTHKSTDDPGFSVQQMPDDVLYHLIIAPMRLLPLLLAFYRHYTDPIPASAVLCAFTMSILVPIRI